MRAERFIPLTPLSFHILLALAQGRAHGYAIGEAIERASAGTKRPTTGSLYQALKRLQDEGLIEQAAAPSGDRSGGPPRLYFCLTELGREVTQLEAKRLATLLDLAREARMLPLRSGDGGSS